MTPPTADSCTARSAVRSARIRSIRRHGQSDQRRAGGGTERRRRSGRAVPVRGRQPAHDAGVPGGAAARWKTLRPACSPLGQRPADGRVQASAGASWMMPIYCTAGTAGPDTYSSNMRIPIDNESLMFYRLRWRYTPIPTDHIAEYEHGEWFYPRSFRAPGRPATTSSTTTTSTASPRGTSPTPASAPSRCRTSR